MAPDTRTCWWCHLELDPDQPTVTPIGHDDMHTSCAHVALTAIQRALQGHPDA